MATQEILNYEAAMRSFEKAKVKIEELIAKFEQGHKEFLDQVGGNVGKEGALGGNLGTVAQNSYEELITKTFNELRASIDNFMNNKVEAIMRNNTAMEDTTMSIYKG